jgi:hypothetical protein
MKYNSKEIIRPYLTREDKKKRVIDEKTKPIKLISKKASLGDHYLRRPVFMSPNVKPRDVVDFSKLLKQLEEREGIKIRLGDEAVQKLTNIQIDDPEDKAWIAEYNRRKTAGETDDQLKSNPPLGRLQKKKYVNVAENQKLEIKDELERLRQKIMSGLSDLEKKQSLVTLADVASTPLNPTDLNQMKLILDTLKLGTNPKEWGMPDEIDYNTYKLNPGIINLFLINKAIREGRDINKPIIFQNVGGLQSEKAIMAIPKLISGKGFKGKFILKDALIIATRKTPEELKKEKAEEKYNDEIKEEEKDIIINENRIKKIDAKIKDIENKLIMNNDKKTKLEDEETKIDNDKIPLYKQIRTINLDKKISTKDKKKLITPINAQIKAIDRRLKQIPGQIKNFRNTIAGLVNERTTLEARKQKAEDNINDSNNKIATYKQEIIKLKVI